MELEANSVLSSHQASNLLQVTPGSIIRWMDEGLMPSFRTPGGHRRVLAKALAAFARDRGMAVPDNLRPLLARRRILLVDDDPRVLDNLRRRIEALSQDIEVVTADNGIEALIRAGDLKPDLVVLDVFMPGLDGLEACRRLRQLEATRECSIVVVSGHLTPEVETKALEAGAVACMAKPVPVEALRRWCLA